AVRFQPAIDAMIDAGVDVWLEISAHPALAHSIQECLAARSIESPVLSSSRRDSEHETTLETAMSLHRAGVALDFLKLSPSRRLLSLPTYPWDKSRWWSESSEWRESRLGSGGRGLLEVRLPRANPSWVMRLDPRHMAFLKDHKVENLVIFPAAAFVELVLEAGVQLFEGRPFVIEDFEIRKPLIIPDPPSGIQTELSYNPNDRTFAVWSKLERSPAWSLHVIGSLRSERVDSEFAKATSRPETEFAKDFGDESLERVKVEDYYGYLRDIGLRYGDEFRPIRELAAGNGRSKGKVQVSDAIAARAGEYSLHPVLLDGALQIFSAGAATIERKKTQLKLPVHFTKILFLRSPGSGSFVRAETQHCNDEYVEGKIELYDETGRPCVLVEGFRAISVSGARRGAAQSSSRNVVYHLEWEQTPSVSDSARLNPVPLTRLREVAQAALAQVIDLRGRSDLETAMAAGDEMAAAQLASALRKMQGQTSNYFSADSLGIAEPMRQIFKRLVSALVSRGWAKATVDGFETTDLFTSAADSADQSLRTFISRYSAHLPEALLCAATSAELAPILRGEKDAVHVLFSEGSADLLEEFYGEGVYTGPWLAAIAAAVQDAIRHAPEGYVLRILEVGAGTGGLSAQVLPAIAGESYSYVFSDVSAGFFSSAAQKLAGYPGVEYKTFDIEKPAIDQGFEAGSFDFVIGTNAVHAAKDLRSALRHIYELVAPGGTLAFMDLAHPHLWTDMVFGLTSGWWRFEDRNLRQFHPLLERPAWEAVLRETGFSETVSLAGLLGPQGEGQMALMARKPSSSTATPLSVKQDAEASRDSSWLVFANGSGLSEQLIERLRSQGTRCRVVRRANRFGHSGPDSFTLRTSELEDWNELFRQCAGEAPPERFVYLWPLEESAETDPGLLGTEALLHLVQATENTKYPVKFRIDLVTRGAQPAGRAGTTTGVAQGPVLGLLRVIRNEYPNVSAKAIDLDSNPTPSDLSRLWGELHSVDAEREVAYRSEARYVQRLVRGQSPRDEWLDRQVPVRLETRERGHLEGLHFAGFTPRPCGPGEVLIDVKAAGLNFRDALKALGLYPGEAPDANAFGDEVAGIVREVGSAVDHVAPGDKVFGLSVFGLASQTVTRGSDVRRMPVGLSFEQAATLPVVFMTAWHSLVNVARLRKGEWVLVHAGAGGVGMAAIQIAHHIGAKVIATAGSSIKRELLEILGVEQVVDSRRADFTDTVLKKTNGRGVDAVLNALAGEAIPMGLSCLGEFGRFIEIGKRDIYLNTRIPLRPLRNNASFHVVAMDAVFARDEALTRQLLEQVADLVEQGGLVSLPFRSYPASRAEAAFRLLAQGKHIGKVLVTFPQPFLPRRGEPLKPGFSIRSDGAYLITGAFGGFGKVLARWLVRSGARHLVLTSRSGAATPEAEAFLDELRALDTEVKVVRADVGVAKDLERLMSEVRALNQPLRGIFHLAMVIDDAPLAALTPERLRSVITPKAQGAWLLHESTRDLPLDCFVMFSSVSSLFGNPAQGNYASANAFLDALAHYRQGLGLPALTVNWGVLGEEGYVARTERVAEFLARQGTTELSPGEVTSLLESFLSAGVAQVMAIRVDWTKWRQFFRGMQENPLLERLFATIEGQDTVERTSDLRLKIESASPGELEGLVSQAVREAVGSVLRVKPDTLRDDQPLTDLGLDSLMGVEIESSIEGSTGVSLPPSSLIRARTIGQIVELIIEHMGAKRPGATSAGESRATAESASANEVNFEALSDEEIERLLNAEAGKETNE
ncbi:MAG: SDR family NAD(P)-dependent oxidoreductase, partial [Verrucomicrobia bacterium]|nr:SDR family NAD(P)-dependent oxidoreductase [Verrucomicrobiota bacterium]